MLYSRIDSSSLAVTRMSSVSWKSRELILHVCKKSTLRINIIHMIDGHHISWEEKPTCALISVNQWYKKRDCVNREIRFKGVWKIWNMQACMKESTVHICSFGQRAFLRKLSSTHFLDTETAIGHLVLFVSGSTVFCALQRWMTKQIQWTWEHYDIWKVKEMWLHY